MAMNADEAERSMTEFMLSPIVELEQLVVLYSTVQKF